MTIQDHLISDIDDTHQPEELNLRIIVQQKNKYTEKQTKGLTPNYFYTCTKKKQCIYKMMILQETEGKPSTYKRKNVARRLLHWQKLMIHGCDGIKSHSAAIPEKERAT